jgi:hypothetical protein
MTGRRKATVMPLADSSQRIVFKIEDSYFLL